MANQPKNVNQRNANLSNKQGAGFQDQDISNSSDMNRDSVTSQTSTTSSSSSSQNRGSSVNSTANQRSK